MAVLASLKKLHHNPKWHYSHAASNIWVSTRHDHTCRAERDVGMRHVWAKLCWWCKLRPRDLLNLAALLRNAAREGLSTRFFRATWGVPWARSNLLACNNRELQVARSKLLARLATHRLAVRKWLYSATFAFCLILVSIRGGILLCHLGWQILNQTRSLCLAGSASQTSATSCGVLGVMPPLKCTEDLEHAWLNTASNQSKEQLYPSLKHSKRQNTIHQLHQKSPASSPRKWFTTTRAHTPWELHRGVRVVLSLATKGFPLTNLDIGIEQLLLWYILSWTSCAFECKPTCLEPSEP